MLNLERGPPEPVPQTCGAREHEKTNLMPGPCFFQFLFEPAVQPLIPVEVGGELAAAAFERDALGVLPLLAAGGATPGGGKGIPDVAAGAGPVGAAVGLPGALGAFYFDVVGHVKPVFLCLLNFLSLGKAAAGMNQGFRQRIARAGKAGLK